MTRDEAINVVACHLVASIIKLADWEDYPEIGEDDWADIICQAVRQVRPTSRSDFTAAYWYLAARAETTA